MQLFINIKYFEGIQTKVVFKSGLAELGKQHYLKGQPLQFRGRDLCVFSERFAFKMHRDTILLKIKPNSACLVQEIEVEAWNCSKYVVGVEFGSGSIKKT